MVCFFSAGRGKKQRNLRIAALLFFWGGVPRLPQKACISLSLLFSGFASVNIFLFTSSMMVCWWGFVMVFVLVVELCKQCDPSKHPMFGWFVRRNLKRKHKVGRVTGGGQNTLSFARLVQRGKVMIPFRDL